MRTRDLFVWSVFCGAVNCTRPENAVPSTETPPPVVARPSPAPPRPDAAALEERPRITLEMHVPGAEPNRYLHATLIPNERYAMQWCVNASREPCEESSRVNFALTDEQQFFLLLRDVRSMPPCEPLARMPGDRIFRLNIGGVQYEDGLPLVVQQIDTRSSQTCAKHLRMAAWIARRLGAM